MGRQAGDSELGVVLGVKRRGVNVRRGHRRRGRARAHVVHSRRLVRGGDLPRLPLPPSAGRGAVLDRAVVVDEGPHEALRARGAYPVRRGERHGARRGGGREGERQVSVFLSHYYYGEPVSRARASREGRIEMANRETRGAGAGSRRAGRTVVEQGRGTGRHDVLTDGSLRLDRQFRPGFLGHGAVVALPDGRPVVAPARSVTTSTSDACSSPRVSSRVCRHFFPDCLFLTEGS